MPNTEEENLQEELNNAYYHALCKGDVETVQEMLQKRLVDVDEFVGLRRAIESGNLSFVQVFIRAGADVNTSFGYGDDSTALQAACIDGPSMEVIQELLKAVTNVDQ